MRVLWLGDLGAQTGFSTVTNDLGQALIAQGVDLRVFSFRDTVEFVPAWAADRLVVVDREGEFLTWDETIDARTRMRSIMRGVFLERDGWAPEAVVVLGDPASVIRAELLDLLPEGLPAYHYVPIEGVALPPYWTTIWQRILPIAMAKSGAREIAKLTGVEPPVVYHGVDTETFYPASPRHPIEWPDDDKTRITSRADAKRAFGIDPKATVLLRTDANMPRKAYGSLFRALAPVLAANPDTLLFCHTRKVGEGGNMDEMRSHFPPHISGRIVVPDFHDRYGGLPRYALATLYNAADIYVSNSCEGFGLTIAEALACGVPAVGLDGSAVPEVIGPAGVTVPGHPVENIYAHFWGVADERAFGAAVHELIRNKTARWRLAALGPDHIRSTFSWTASAQAMAAVIGVGVPA